MSETVEIFEDVTNPLDSVEEVLAAHEWDFARMNHDELYVEISGKMCSYRLYFIWQEEFSAMQFCCQYDMMLPEESVDQASEALMRMNAGLWLGHFDIPRETRIPTFRYTSLLRGMTQTSGTDHIEDLVDIALAECERYYPAFYLLMERSCTQMPPPSRETLSLALMDPAGES